jgi:integrase
MKIGIGKCKVRNGHKWRVRWFEAGRIHRKFFGSRDAAEAQGARLRGEMMTMRRTLADLPTDDQKQLLRIYDEAKRRGWALASMIDRVTSVPEMAAENPVAAVLEEMLSAKRNAGRAPSYLKSLRQIIIQFTKGRDRMSVDRFTATDLERFMDSKDLRYRSTLRARLSTLFKFAVRRGYRADNPCDRLESAAAAHVVPEVMTVEETVTALDWFREHPRAMAWFILSAFAGLRPMEAQKTTWKEMNFTEGWIRVEAQTTKVRQRRVVYPQLMVLEWLRRAKQLKSELPLTTKQRTVELRELRTVLGWKSFKQDVTRHSAASYWLSASGSANMVATALGTSESILRRNYMALVTKVEAARYWGITPQGSVH